MNIFRTMTAAGLILASALAPHIALAQSPGVTRNDLQRHDLSIPGREVVQVRVDFAPGAAFGAGNPPFSISFHH